MAAISIRRGWTIPARPEGADREERRQRRLLDAELALWGGPRPQRAEEEGPVRLRELATAFAPERIPLPQAQGAAFRGVSPEEERIRQGGIAGQQFAETVRALPERDRVRLRALARELERRDMTAIDLFRLPQKQRGPAIEEIRQAVDIDPEVRPVSPGSIEEEVQRRFEADPEVQRLRQLLAGSDLSDNERQFIEGVSLKNKLQEFQREVSQEVVPGTGALGAAANIGEVALRAERALRPVGEVATGVIRAGGEQFARGRGVAVPAPATEAIAAGDIGQLREVGAEVPVVPDLLNPINFVPIPIVDPLVARILGLAGKGGVRVARPVLERLMREAATEGGQEGVDVAKRQALQVFIDDAQRTLTEAPSVRPAEGVPARAAEPPVARAEAAAPAPGRLGALSDEALVARWHDATPGSDAIAEINEEIARRGIPHPASVGRQRVPPQAPVREPTVRRLDLSGREADTFATERELGGIRETQARLDIGTGEQPIETAGPLFAGRRVSEPRQQNFAQFLRERGTPNLDEMDHGLLSPSGRVSAPARRAALQREEVRLSQLGEAQAEFQGLVDSGAVVDPTGRYSPRAVRARPTRPELGSIEDQVAQAQTIADDATAFLKRRNLTASARQGAKDLRATATAKLAILDEMQRSSLSPADALADIEREFATGERVSLFPISTRRAPREAFGVTRVGRERVGPLPSGVEREADARVVEAIDEISSNLGLPAPAGRPIPSAAGGGAPLTRERVLARQVTEQADEARDAINTAMAGPAREARESWRLYSGANNEAAIRRAAWRENTYDLFDDVGIAINRNSDDQADNAIELLERAFGDEAARAPTGAFRPQEREAAQALYSRLDDATERLLVADPDFQFKMLDEYFPHQFKKLPQPLRERLRGRRGLQLAPGFAKRRKLSGMLGEILESRPDLDLVTWDPVAYIDRHIAAVDNYVNSLETIRGLRAKGLIVPRAGAPASWRVPDVASFKIGEKLQGWVAEPKVAQTLEQMFGRSAFDEHGALRIAKTVRETAFRAKVFGGLFQQIDYTFRDAGLGLSELVQLRPKGAVRAWVSPLRSVARMVTPALDRRLTKLAAENPELRLLYRNGLAAGFDPSIGDKAIRAEGRAFSSLPGVQQVLDFMGGGAYERFHRETLEQAGLVNLQKYLKRGFPRDEAARRAVEETNVFFSSIPNWQSAIRSKTGRDLIKFPFFATGELEGWFRLPFQAPGAFAGIIGATTLLAEMLNKLFTGEWLSTDQLKPYKAEPPSGLIGKVLPVSYNTHFLRPLLPWKGADGRDLYLDILGQSDTPFRWALDPQFATQTRLGQLPRLALDIGEIAHGEAPAFGEQIKNPQDVGQFLFQQVSPIGISALTGTEQERIGRLGAAVQTSGLNVSAQSQRARFAELYQQKYGTPPQPDISPRQLDPELAAQAGYGPARETEFGQQRAEVVAGEEEQLTDLARIVLRGNPDAMEQFGDELGDFFRFRSGVTETMVRELNLPEREASLVQDWYDLDPRDRRDPETGQPDWDRFNDRQDRILKALRREGTSGRQAAQALKRPSFEFADPDLQRVYEAQRELREGLDAYYEAESGEPRERYRQRNPDVDAKLYLLGRVSRVMTSAAQGEVRSLSRRLLGTEVEAGRGERRGRRFGEPIRIGPVEPIAIGR